MKTLSRCLFLLLSLPATLQAGQVIFTEVMYHPPESKPEFIEVTNLTSNRIDSARWTLSDGVEYTFPDFDEANPAAHFLQEYERIILSSADAAATRAAWPSIPAGVRIFGPWTGALDNGGETITLKNAASALQATLTYGDSGKWPVAADGTGHSLQIVNQNAEVDDWHNWRASRMTGGSPGLDEPLPASPVPLIAFNEVHFGATGEADWVEVVNHGSVPVDLAGFFVSSQNTLTGPVAFSGTLAAGGFTSVAVNFLPDGTGDLVLYLGDAGNNVLDTAEVIHRAGVVSLQAVPAGSEDWYAVAAPTQNAANNAVPQTAVVINELMVNPPSGHDEGEFVELVNQSGAAVNLSGWEFSDGISFVFPAGTTLAAGQYLVVGKNPAWLTAHYPGLGPVAGPFSGTLKNSGERVRLVDAQGNPADEVDYKKGGQWPAGISGGSSLELMHPAMDNSRPSSWRDSDESGKSAFQTFTHTGDYKELRGTSGGISAARELLLNLVSDGHVILKNIKLSKGTAPGTNLILTGDATSHNGNGNAGFLCTGTHCESDTLADGFHLISRGGGDTKGNKAEVDVTGIARNDILTLSFEGRWISGSPLLVAQTWDRSFGNVFRFPIPDQLGTPGAANSRAVAAAAPTVDSMNHSPAVPTSTEPVTVTARVSSFSPLTGVSVVHRQDTVAGNQPWVAVAMNDSGTGGDAVAGDGLWSGVIPARSNSTITQFYIRAETASGAANECPRNGEDRPGMYIVANSKPSTVPGTLIQRNIISLYDRNALTATVGFSALYDWDHPRMSNYGFNSTIIFNESEIYYNCELRRGGSPWTRTTANTLDRSRWKPPGDQLFRGRSKSGVDNDGTSNRRFHNRIIRYVLELLGYPVPDAEFIQQIVNADPPRLGDDMEPTDSDFFDRAYPDGSSGELYEIDDAWYMFDTSNGGNENRISADSVTGRWDLRDWSSPSIGTWPSEESPIFFHGNWPLRFPEDKYDYAALASMIKIATNNNQAVSTAADAGYRERMERVLNIDRTAAYAAVRGYAGDWDNFTSNRGKNGYFYKPPGDGRFEFHHWDSDLAFQNLSENFLGTVGSIGWTNLTSRPWFRQKFNHYLTEVANRYTKNSPRMNAWLAAMNYQASVGSGLAPFKTNVYNYPSAWFNSRDNSARSFIGSTNLNRTFLISNFGGQTVTTPFLTLNGQAPSSVERVVVAGQPSAVFNWVPVSSNLGQWEITGLALRQGLNTLTVQALQSDDSIQETVTFTITLSDNAPPVAVLEANPSSGNVAVGETLLLDATGSFDPEGTALTRAWSVVPAAGVALTEPAPGWQTVRFSVPGDYTLSLVLTDDAGKTTEVSLPLSVYNAADFESFGSGGALAAPYTVLNAELRDNFSASTWYSTEDQKGRLILQVQEDSAKPLVAENVAYPSITRPLPVSADFALQTKFRPDSREFGNWRTGLILDLSENGSAVRYAFGLDAGLNLLVERSVLPAAYSTLSTTEATGSGATLRVLRSGGSLLFQAGTDHAWTTLHTQPLPTGSTAQNGGIYLATALPTSVRMSYDYLLLADPSAVNEVLRSLRITELQFNPAAGGVEFLELRNTGDQSISLNGVSFGMGQPFSMAGSPKTAYTFGAETLAPGEFITLTDNVTLFRTLYGNGPRLAPAWTDGSLNNSGERIVLLDAEGNAIHDFEYGVTLPWPVAANGTGPSMEVVASDGDYSLGTNWRGSSVDGGTPGTGVAPDTDGDGIPDASEALFGTDPANPSDIPSAVLTPAPAGTLTLTWPSVPGVVYRVQASSGLSGWTTVQTFTGTGTWTFTPTAGEPRRYYQVVASPQ